MKALYAGPFSNFLSGNVTDDHDVVQKFQLKSSGETVEVKVKDNIVDRYWNGYLLNGKKATLIGVDHLKAARENGKEVGRDIARALPYLFAVNAVCLGKKAASLVYDNIENAHKQSYCAVKAIFRGGLLGTICGRIAQAVTDAVMAVVTAFMAIIGGIGGLICGLGMDIAKAVLSPFWFIKDSIEFVSEGAKVDCAQDGNCQTDKCTAQNPTTHKVAAFSPMPPAPKSRLS